MDQCPKCKSNKLFQSITFTQCLNCGKTFDITDETKCADCDGTGLHFIDNDPITETNCQYCKGTGKK